MNGRDLLLAWLKDAHGMETALIEVLEHQMKDAEGMPQVQDRLQQHLMETERHAQTVQQCIESMGDSPSSLKSGLSSIFGKVQALSTEAAQDEMIKNALQDYGAESFEVASYRALIAAAQDMGEAQIVTALQQNLREDEAMQQWLEQNLPTLVQQTLSSLTAGASR